MQLEIANVSVQYGSIKALREVSLTVQSGTVAAIIGANGAGKSTLLKAIVGLVPLSSGSVIVNGQTVDRLPTEARIKAGIALSPEGRRLFPEMTVHDNLLSGAFGRRDTRKVASDLADVYALFPRLTERRTNLGRSLSGGEQQMCAIGRALMAAPKLLLLDEPSLGLAPVVIKEMARSIRAIATTGVTVVLVEQNSHLALSLAQTGHLLESGRLVRSDSSAALLKDQDLQKAYLGDDPLALTEQQEE